MAAARGAVFPRAVAGGHAGRHSHRGDGDVGLSWRRGAALLVAYGIVVLGEMALKRRVARERPFRALPNVLMAQPRQPEDTSFPSGDALRVWLMACALGAWLPSPWCWPLAGVATLVSLGRIALGVHFPLDVIAGTGLGFIAAALAVWLGG